tara:strand:- start:1135 stop:1398 length:264 start_codon:yes stop_codon:yes gene_type:complete
MKYSTVSPSQVKTVISQHKKGLLKKLPIGIKRFLEYASLQFINLKDIEKSRLNDLIVAGIVVEKKNCGQRRYIENEKRKLDSNSYRA